MVLVLLFVLVFVLVGIDICLLEVLVLGIGLGYLLVLGDLRRLAVLVLVFQKLVLLVSDKYSNKLSLY